MNSFQKGNFSERQFEDLIKKKGYEVLDTEEFKFEEPKTSKKLTPKDLINLEIYSENKALEEKVDVAQEELKNLSKEFFFYIVIGGVLVYVLTKLIDEYFKNILSLWILLIILV